MNHNPDRHDSAAVPVSAEEELRALGARLRAEVARSDAQLEELERIVGRLEWELEQRDRALLAIHRSKVWKAASLYWAVLRRLGLSRPTRSATADLTPAVGAGTSPVNENHSPLRRPGRYDVVCFAIIDWDFRIQRPQQLMMRFADEGHRVFYVSKRFKRTGSRYSLRAVYPGVFEVCLRGPRRDIYADRLDEDDTDVLFRSLDALRRGEGLAATVSMVELPFWRPLAKAARERCSWPMVYDCMDLHAGFAVTASWTESEDDALLREADAVLASSAMLHRRALECNPRVSLIRNACDYDHFAVLPPARRDSRPVVGYYGAIAEWFDTALVAAVARRRPDWHFLLIGSTAGADLAPFADLRNLELVGERPYAEIPSWLARFDVGLIPFRRVPLTEATNPVKAYEMLAGGVPVVSVPIPEMRELSPLVRLASSAEEFEREIEAAFEERTPSHQQKRREYAAGHTWRERFDTLRPTVEQAFPLASIVVVTYENADLTRACLESLEADTTWPNVEVIVVDNGSSDGTRELLAEWERRRPKLEAIYNDENRGFAAATNQGLARAAGEILVLLNNDTVCTRGWLAGLIRHLRGDSSLGLVGASTNAIGNEAKVEVGYADDLDAMRAWARVFVRRHDRERFEIPMLAMFCLAMRREVYERVGQLDEGFEIGMFEDDDYAERVRRAGWRVACARDVFVHHWQRAAFDRMPSRRYQEIFERNRRYFETKWGRPWTPHGGPERGSRSTSRS